MQLELIMEDWRMDTGSKIMLALNNRSEEAQQSILRLDRSLKKAYAEHEIPVILRRHSPILGCSMLDYLIGVENSAQVLMSRLTYESRKG